MRQAHPHTKFRPNRSPLIKKELTFLAFPAPANSLTRFGRCIAACSIAEMLEQYKERLCVKLTVVCQIESLLKTKQLTAFSTDVKDLACPKTSHFIARETTRIFNDCAIKARMFQFKN